MNANDEAQAAAAWLGDKHRAGYAWRDMVVLAPSKRNWRDPVTRALDREQIPLSHAARRQVGTDRILEATICT